MGFFSWKTTDTGKSICNSFSKKKTFRVHMTSSDGTTYIEDKYEGYGEFGGKDFYVLLAEMNKDIIDNVDGDELRDKGIELYFGDYENVKFPLLTRHKPEKYENVRPEHCEYQGYFY